MDLQTELTVGHWTVSFGEARQIVNDYTRYRPGDARSKGTIFAWPFYDGLETGGSDALADGDLLAPVLLNVPVSISTFGVLREVRGDLESRLAAVPNNVALRSASDDVVASVARLFAVLDEVEVPGVRGTMLSKILHRKRPALVPLHDQFVRNAYVPSRVERVAKRTWEEYFTQVMLAMRDDLSRAPEAWDELSRPATAAEPALTELRVLDILAWSLGRGAGASDSEGAGGA